MDNFNIIFITIATAVILELFMPSVDTLSLEKGYQGIERHHGHNWPNEQIPQDSPDHQKSLQEIWQGEFGLQDGKLPNREQEQSWYRNQHEVQRNMSQLPNNETTRKKVVWKNNENLKRWQNEKWQNEQRLKTEKNRQEAIGNQTEEYEQQRQEKWQTGPKKERQFEQLKEENQKRLRNQAIPLDSVNYARGQNKQQLQGRQLTQHGAFRHYYPDKLQQYEYQQRREKPRAAFLAPSVYPEKYLNSREFPVHLVHPEYEITGNQPIHNKENLSKVRIAHIPIPNITGSKLISLPLSDSVAKVMYLDVGSQGFNKEQKQKKSKIQIVEKQQGEMVSDAIVDNTYEKEIKSSRETEIRLRTKSNQKQFVPIQEQITDIKSRSKPINNQPREIEKPNDSNNNINQVQNKVTNRQIRQRNTNDDIDILIMGTSKLESLESITVAESNPQDQSDQVQETKPEMISGSIKNLINIPKEKTDDQTSADSIVTGKNTSRLKRYRQRRPGQTRPLQTNQENIPGRKELKKVITVSNNISKTSAMIDKNIREKQQEIKPLEQETEAQKILSTGSKNQNEDQLIDETNDNQKPKKYRRHRHRQIKLSQDDERSKGIDTMIDNSSERKDTTEVNLSVDKRRRRKKQRRSTKNSTNKDKITQNQEQSDTKVTDKVQNPDDTATNVISDKLPKTVRPDNKNILGTALTTKLGDRSNNMVIKNIHEKDRPEDESEQWNDANYSNITDDDNNDDGYKENKGERAKKVLCDDKGDDDLDSVERDQQVKKEPHFNDDDSFAEKEIIHTMNSEESKQSDDTMDIERFIPHDDKDDINISALKLGKPTENDSYLLSASDFGEDSPETKTEKDNENEIPAVDAPNPSDGIENSLIPRKYANTINFLRTIAIRVLRGEDFMEDILKEPVIKDYVNKITEKIMPVYLIIKAIVEPHAQRENCKVDDVLLQRE